MFIIQIHCIIQLCIKRVTIRVNSPSRIKAKRNHLKFSHGGDHLLLLSVQGGSEIISRVDVAVSTTSRFD